MKILTLGLLLVGLNLQAATKKISSTSKIGFEITKYKVAQVVEGRFKEFSGSVDMNEGKLENVNVTIKTASIDTGSEKRDNHLRSGDFFDVEKETNKNITFKSDGPVMVSDSFKVPGKLKMKGVTKPVVLNVTKKGENTFEATTVINKNDFGIEWNRPLEKGAWESLKSSLQGFAGNIIGNDVNVKLMINLN